MAQKFAFSKFMASVLLCAVGLSPVLAAASAPDAVKLAVFDFEFEDMSAASAGATALSDSQYLADVTSKVRDLFQHSGRYRLIDVDSADAAEVKARSLHMCDGCDAAIAQGLGAEQSFVGVVKRISRMEYTVRFQIRDASTGAVLSSVDSGLRMGADYSWSRGAIRLIKAQLLEKQSVQ